MKTRHYLIGFLAVSTILYGGIVIAQTTSGRVSLPVTKKTTITARRAIDRIQTATQTTISNVRYDLRGKISAITDVARQNIALMIIGQLDHINKLAVDHFNDVLDHLDNVLSKIKSRTDKVKSSGADVSVVERSIQKAADAIAQARTAVNAQAKKSYQNTINAQSISTNQASTSEGQNNLMSSLRVQFQAARNALKTDLFTLRDGVIKNARTTVQDALRALMQVTSTTSK